MNMKINKESRMSIIDDNEIIIKDTQSVLDLIAIVAFEHDCNKIIINKEAIIEDFFDLSTRIAGEVLQKFVNYNIKIAIYGDFNNYNSKALKDFIRESNEGKDIFFLKTKEDAIKKLEII